MLFWVEREWLATDRLTRFQRDLYDKKGTAKLIGMFLSHPLAMLPGILHAQEKPVYPAPAKPLKAEYTIYSGGLGDEQAPTKTERKLAIEITGTGAKEIFDSPYPDAKGVSCSSEKDERLRRKGHAWCSFSPRDGYRCFLGFGLRTGESIAGGSC